MHWLLLVVFAMAACGAPSDPHAGHHSAHEPAPTPAATEVDHGEHAAMGHGEHAAMDHGEHAAMDHGDHSRHHDHGAMLLTRASESVRMIATPDPSDTHLLTLTLSGPTGPVTDLRRAPERQLLVYVVSDDLASFARIEAAPKTPGFSITHALTPATYHLFGELDSVSLGYQLAPATLSIGPAVPARPLPPFEAAQRDGDVTATLSLSPSPLVAGDLNGVLTFTDAAGAPLTDLQALRSGLDDALIDALIVGQDLTTLSRIHMHGRVPLAGQPSLPSIKFHTRIAAGTQRLFIVAQRASAPLTFAWTLVATQ